VSTANRTYDNFVLSNYPYDVTVGDLKSLLGRSDKESKNRIVDFIYHRLHQRYIVPLLHVPTQYKSGFLMMASACLMIETMQAFYTGKKETKGKSRKSFKAFFEREHEFFPGLAADESNFYRNIRCGILHQAETRGGYRILRKGRLFDAKEKTINANAFIAALEESLASYIANVRLAETDSTLWQNAAKKVAFICDNCQS
jgi:hypothetical protein